MNTGIWTPSCQGRKQRTDKNRESAPGKLQGDRRTVPPDRGPLSVFGYRFTLLLTNRKLYANIIKN